MGTNEAALGRFGSPDKLLPLDLDLNVKQVSCGEDHMLCVTGAPSALLSFHFYFFRQWGRAWLGEKRLRAAGIY